MGVVICSLLWDANRKSRAFSSMYDEGWALRLFNGFARNLTLDHRFVLYTDRQRDLPAHIEQRIVPGFGKRGYSDCIRPYELNTPMILVGLDTMVVGNIDHLAEHCLAATGPAYPLDPYRPRQVCNGVGLIPAGHGFIAERHRGQNDMEWVRRFKHDAIDRLFPGQVVSYKGSVKGHGLGDARIVYFHGEEKPHQLTHLDWIREHWR